MNPIAFLEKIHTGVFLALMAGTILAGRYLVAKSRKPVEAVPVSVASSSLHKK